MYGMFDNYSFILTPGHIAIFRKLDSLKFKLRLQYNKK